MLGRRCAKISAAKDRISKAKKMLVTQVPKKRNEPLTSIPRNEVPVDTSEHPKVAPPGSSGQETEVSIDWEDLLIEYLILGGVSPLHVSSFNLCFSYHLDENIEFLSLCPFSKM
jgi:hypothetical protein